LSNGGPARGDASALLVIDMLNTYEHEDAEKLVSSVAAVAPVLGEMVERARAEGTPLIYVNDNYGDWNLSAEELSARALAGRNPELVEPVLPVGDASFVIKARHSVFYSTPLEYLLQTQGIGRVILAGQVTEQCILYSALDAYVRHFRVSIPRDAVAHIHAHLAEAALEMMETNMRAEITSASECRLGSR
jgi:nicotinamidase-related amidase